MAVAIDSRRSSTPSLDTGNLNDLNTAAKVDGMDLDALRRSCRGGVPNELPELKRPMQLAGVPEAAIQRARDFDNFAVALAPPINGIGGAAIMMANVNSAVDWATRAATESFEKNDFSSKIDPGDKAAKDLAQRIVNSPKPLGIDEMFKLAQDSIQANYGNRDATSSCVVLANVLKRATGAQRVADNGKVLTGDTTDQALYRAVNDKLVDYRGDGSPVKASNDIYYHAATLGAIYKGGGGGAAIMAAVVENFDKSQADDRIEADAQTQLVTKFGLRTFIPPVIKR